MKPNGREKVKDVRIDLSSPYRSMIRRYFPMARIVAETAFMSCVSSSTTSRDSPAFWWSI